MFGGRRATLRANPNAPGNELLFRITKLPGDLFLRKLIAEKSHKNMMMMLLLLLLLLLLL